MKNVVGIFYSLYLGIKNKFDFYLKNKIIIKGKKSIIERTSSSKLKSCCIEVYGDNNRIVIGDKCCFSGLRILIIGDNCSITFGKNVRVNASKIQPTVINAIDGNISIGDNSLLSNNIEIHTSDYHGIYDQYGKRINYEKDIVIGEHVWVGLGVTILKGARIASNSIVGAKSLISKAFDEENVIIAGSPASIIKHNIVWDVYRNDCMYM